MGHSLAKVHCPGQHAHRRRRQGSQGRQENKGKVDSGMDRLNNLKKRLALIIARSVHLSYYSGSVNNHGEPCRYEEKNKNLIS